MREKLSLKGGTKQDIDYVINKLKELDLIDDKAFIEDYLGYAEEKGIGKNKIKQELIKKGISIDEANKIRFSSASEKKKALALIPSLERKYSKYSYEQKKQHIYNALLSKGFDHEIASIAINSISKKNEKDESLKLKNDYKKALTKYSKKYEGRELKERIIRSLASKGYRYNDINRLIGGMDDDF